MSCEHLFTVIDALPCGAEAKHSIYMADLPFRPLHEFLLEAYTVLSASKIRERLSAIHWDEEPPYPRDSEEFKAYERKRHSASFIQGLLADGGIEGVEEKIKKLDEVWVAEDLNEQRKNGIKNPVPKVRVRQTNIEIINGKKMLRAIDYKSYSSSAEWKYEFIFDLIRDTLEIKENPLFISSNRPTEPVTTPRLITRDMLQTN